MAWIAHHIEGTDVAKCDTCGANSMAWQVGTNEPCMRCEQNTRTAATLAAKQAKHDALCAALANTPPKPISELWTSVFGNDPFATK
jgi:hypothetical protein